MKTFFASCQFHSALSIQSWKLLGFSLSGHWEGEAILKKLNLAIEKFEESWMDENIWVAWITTMNTISEMKGKHNWTPFFSKNLQQNCFKKSQNLSLKNHFQYRTPVSRFSIKGENVKSNYPEQWSSSHTLQHRLFFHSLNGAVKLEEEN